MRHNAFFFRSSKSQRGGFTLLQLLVVIGLISVLAAVLVGQFGRGRAAVRRAECDIHLKEIVLAMDTFRQETARLPGNLMELKTKRYLPLDTLRCTADPDLATKGQDASYSSYADFYVLRDVVDDGELPLIVCPFHEKDGSHGAQGFKGGYTKTFTARPSTLLSGVAGAVTVTRPGQGILKMSATAPFEVRGGDRIQVGAGTGTLTFADGSKASLKAGSEMSVLESYMESQRTDSIYTLVRQFAGTISYSVVPGNKFDVATPTATAGALGTEFTIQLVEALATNSATTPGTKLPLETLLTVTQHAVALTAQGRTIEVDTEDTAGVRSDDPANASKAHAPRNSKDKKIKKTKKDKEKDKDKDKDKDD